MKPPGWDGRGPLPGHGLQSEGKPHYADVISAWRRVSGREGRALCSCGWTSAHLGSDAARQAAHREHKQTIAAQARVAATPS